MKNKFVFYTSWNDVLQKLDEAHFRRAVNNLCLDCEDKPPVLTDAIDEMFWSFVKPIMNFNEAKRQKRINSGKKGGEAKATNSYQNVANDSNTYQNVANPTDNSKELRDKGKELIDKGKELNGQELNDNPVCKQEWVGLTNKINNSGWNSLSVAECSTFYELKEIYG